MAMPEKYCLLRSYTEALRHVQGAYIWLLKILDMYPTLPTTGVSHFLIPETPKY